VIANGKQFLRVTQIFKSGKKNLNDDRGTKKINFKETKLNDSDSDATITTAHTQCRHQQTVIWIGN